MGFSLIENYMILHNNRVPGEDPLVIEKKNGHPGSILPYEYRPLFTHIDICSHDNHLLHFIL